MANKLLARAAISAVTDRNFETRPTYCSRFIRQVSESVYDNDTYDAEFGASASITGRAFINAGLGVRYEGQEIEEGDLLFKVNDGFGHVGAYVGDVPGHSKKRLVAENSSTTIGRIQGAKGYRSLSEFGRFNVLVRLPSLKRETSMVALPEPRLIVARTFEDRWIYAAVSSAVYDATRARFTVNAAQFGGIFKKHLLSKRVTVREACDMGGLDLDESLVAEGNHLADLLDPRQFIFVR